MRGSRKVAAGFAIALFLAFNVTGCGGSDRDSSERPLLSGFNAVPDVDQVTFLREEELWAGLVYGASTAFTSVDEDQYDVNFDTLLPGDETESCQGDVDLDDIKDDDECTRIATVSINVLNDREYVVALIGSFENRRVEVYDKLAHEFDTEDTSEDGDPEDQNLEIQFFHWSDALGPIDVYLEPPGTNLSPTMVRGTLEVGEQFNGLIDEGEYVLTLTPIADPTTPIYTSTDFDLDKQTRVAFALLEAPFSSTSPIQVTLFRDLGGDLLDRRAVTELRAAHGATIVSDVDIYAQGDFSDPFLGGLQVNSASPYLTVDPTAVNDLQLDITPAGNPGALLAREIISVAEGSRSTFYLVDESINAVDGLTVQDRFRRLFHFAELRLINSFGTALDWYVVPAGDNLFTSTPIETLSTGSAGILHIIEPGNYDVVMAREGTDIFVFGPREVQLDGSGAYTIVGVATPDATAADVILLDDFIE